MTAGAVQAAASEAGPGPGAFSPFAICARNAQCKVIAGFSFLGIMLGVAVLIFIIARGRQWSPVLRVDEPTAISTRRLPT